MTYTAWKKRLQPGTKLHVDNHRRPWRSRDVHVTSVSRRYFEATDEDCVKCEPTRFPLPAASFTRMLDKDTIEILAEKDGPLFAAPATLRSNDEKLLAGQPLFTIKVL